MNPIRATIVVPTSIDRGPLLQYSVGSILQQTVREIEVFIIGDGVHDVTREAVRALMQQDGRVRFFDHPKGPSRGEIYRHQALQEARGEIVCYLCDRDLMLPNHVETMLQLLKNADIATTSPLSVKPDGSIVTTASSRYDLGCSEDRARVLTRRVGIQLSVVGHTLATYQRLPEGWRTTPANTYTDAYMWWQFLADPTCRGTSGHHPTVLYFKRGNHPGMSASERTIELQQWFSLMQNKPEFLRRILGACGGLLESNSKLHRQLRQPLLLRGLTPAECLVRARGKVSNLLTKRPKP